MVGIGIIANPAPAKLANAGGEFPKVVVAEDENLEAGEVGNVLGDLGQLVGAQVEFNHVDPGTNI